MRRFVPIALFLLGGAPALAAPEVAIETGRISGLSAGGVTSYKGIPYAAAPIGPLRWRAPQPVASWQGVRAADRFGPVCIQPVRRGAAAETPPQSEDCLTLNIYRPDDKRGGLPVMFWIHGGGLVGGAGSQPTFDGAAFARRGIVLVTINYRLGQFGFFAHPALTRENADHGQLNNYGFMDQIAALRWVKANIAAFGGDPKRVTIFGESAGGQSVDSLMLAPMARGLFSAAISESGWGRGSFARIGTVAPDGKAPAEQAGVALMKRLGVESNDPADLRAVSADAIREKSTFDLGFGIVLDGTVITDDLWDGFRQRKEAPVPFIVGSTDHEEPQSIEQSEMAVITTPYVHLDELPRLVPAYGSLDTVRFHVTGDVVFVAQARSLASMHARNGYPAWLYRFAGVPEGRPDREQGAPHGSEQPYVFDTLGTVHYPTGPSDARLAAGMNAAWADFATHGRPAANWPVYDGVHVMMFGNNGIALRVDPWKARFDALDAIADPRS